MKNQLDRVMFTGKQSSEPRCNRVTNVKFIPLKRVVINRIRFRALSLCFRVSLFPKPVPTFGRHAVGISRHWKT